MNGSPALYRFVKIRSSSLSPPYDVFSGGGGGGDAWAAKDLSALHSRLDDCIGVFKAA